MSEPWYQACRFFLCHPAALEALGKDLRKMLDGNGSFIRFTYRHNNGPGPLLADLERTSAQNVWANFPPDRFEVF
ncbi:MAG: hypothetical protein KJ717_13810, partial [Proteobacteria bacterium]|nr:hypothetical protein [Pseudomonadota bacterium]